MLNLKVKHILLIVIVIIALTYISNNQDSGSSPGGQPESTEDYKFSDVLNTFGKKQKETSDQITDSFLVTVEGSKYVGESEEGGSNWSFVSIIKKLFGMK